MAATYPQVLQNEVVVQKSYYIASGFTDAENQLNTLSLPNNVYYRDIYFDPGAGKIFEVSTNIQVSTYSLQRQFLYFPQLEQLLVRAYDNNYYPT